MIPKIDVLSAKSTLNGSDLFLIEDSEDSNSKKKVTVDSTRGTSMGTIVHGADDTAARPTGYTVVTWYGTVEPTNAIDGDVWVDTSED